jgi:hypothetical protein
MPDYANILVYTHMVGAQQFVSLYYERDFSFSNITHFHSG